MKWEELEDALSVAEKMEKKANIRHFVLRGGDGFL